MYDHVTVLTADAPGGGIPFSVVGRSSMPAHHGLAHQWRETSSPWRSSSREPPASMRRRASPATAAGPTVSISGSRTNQNLFLLDGAPLQRSLPQHRLELPAAGRASGSQGAHQQLRGRVRAELGLHLQRRHPLGHQRSARRRMGVPAEQQAERAQLLRAVGEAAVDPESVRRSCRRTHPQEPTVRSSAVTRACEFVRNPSGCPRFRSRNGNAAATSPATRTAVRDPQTQQPFPGNHIPASRIDPIARNILDPGVMPLPNRPDGQFVTVPTPENNNQVLMRHRLQPGPAHHRRPVLFRPRHGSWIRRADRVLCADRRPRHHEQHHRSGTRS